MRYEPGTILVTTSDMGFAPLKETPPLDIRNPWNTISYAAGTHVMVLGERKGTKTRIEKDNNLIFMLSCGRIAWQYDSVVDRYMNVIA